MGFKNPFKTYKMKTQRTDYLKEIKKLEADLQIAMFIHKHKKAKKIENKIHFYKDCIIHMM